MLLDFLRDSDSFQGDLKNEFSTEKFHQKMKSKWTSVRRKRSKSSGRTASSAERSPKYRNFPENERNFFYVENPKTNSNLRLFYLTKFDKKCENCVRFRFDERRVTKTGPEDCREFVFNRLKTFSSRKFETKTPRILPVEENWISTNFPWTKKFPLEFNEIFSIGGKNSKWEFLQDYACDENYKKLTERLDKLFLTRENIQSNDKRVEYYVRNLLGGKWWVVLYDIL